MTLPDSTAGAQLATGYFGFAWLVYLDFDGDPLRATTARASLAMSGTGDDDLDGYTFTAVDPSVVEVGDVRNAEGGSDTLSMALSGIVGPDTDLLNTLGDTSLWRGRTVRLWGIVYDETGTQQGACWAIYTGRMSAMQITGSPNGQTIKLDCESYLAAMKEASGRTYLDQSKFDAADNTAALKIGAANGATKGVASAMALPSLPYPSYYIPDMPF